MVCRGKVLFATRQLAVQIADRQRRRRGGGTQHAYWCAECDGWHVGNGVDADRWRLLHKRRRQQRRQERWADDEG